MSSIEILYTKGIISELSKEEQEVAYATRKKIKEMVGDVDNQAELAGLTLASLEIAEEAGVK